MLTRLLISLVVSLATSYVTVAQEISADPEKLRLAERTADRFVERFRRTRDFETVWREFQVSDASCNYAHNGPWSGKDEQLKLTDALLERLYTAYMNCVYLSLAYRLSAMRIVEDGDYDRTIERLLPKDIRAAERKLVSIEAGDEGRPMPQNAKEVEGVIEELHQLARIWRKHMPRNLMRSAVWRANVKYLLSVEGITHLGVGSGNSEICIPDGVKYYIVDKGLFYFYFVEEKRHMKVAGFGIGN